MSEKQHRGVFHCADGKIVEGRAPETAAERKSARHSLVKKKSSEGGISFTFPKNWDDGSGRVRHVQSGPWRGRVMFTSRNEAREIAKRHEGMCGARTTYDH
jgi:hypothetical protein